MVVRTMAFSGELFETFCGEYPEILQSGGRSRSMVDDLQYALELQKGRLDREGLRMECEITPRGHFPKGELSKEWSDGMFRSHMDIRTCNWTRTIFKGDKKVFKDTEDKILYTTATDLIWGAKNIESESYTCPNCGNVTTIGALRDGCPYCGTHFELQDLYPRVGGFYYVKEIGGTEEEVKKDVFKYMIPCAVVFGAFGLLGTIFSGEQCSVIWGLQTIFMTALCAGMGAVLGYFLWAIRKLGSVFYEALRVLPLLPGALGSKKKYEDQLMKTNPDFSFDYFANKVGTLAKMLIFSDNPAALPVCIGDHIDNPYKDVVDALFRGPVIIKSFKREGDYCHIRADVQFDLLYKTGIGFINRRQFVTLYLARDITQPLRKYYSVKKVSCRNCGGSFDASRYDHCPFCGTEYDIRKEDWFVTGFAKKQA